jgi:hypothetical protein
MKAKHVHGIHSITSYNTQNRHPVPWRHLSTEVYEIFPSHLLAEKHTLSGENMVSFGLDLPSVRVKDGHMSIIKHLLHGPKKRKFDTYSLALPSQGDCNYCITYWFYRRCGHRVSILSDYRGVTCGMSESPNALFHVMHGNDYERWKWDRNIWF